MKSREEAAKFWNENCSDANHKEELAEQLGVKRRDIRVGVWHIGMVEVKALLDFIYGGPPQTDSEKVK